MIIYFISKSVECIELLICETSDGVSRLGLGPVFGVSVLVSKDFGLGFELFVSRLCTGYFL